MMMAIGLSQYNVALMHTVNHAFFKALLFLGAGINVLAINPAIFWKLLYKSITKVLQTGQSKGNLIYKILEILRGHTQEVIIIIFFFLDFNNSSSHSVLDLNSSVLLINNLNLSFVTILPLSIFTFCSQRLKTNLGGLSCHFAEAGTKRLQKVGGVHQAPAKGRRGAPLLLTLPLWHSEADLNNKKAEQKSFRTINQNFSSYLAGLFEGDGCI